MLVALLCLALAAPRQEPAVVPLPPEVLSAPLPDPVPALPAPVPAAVPQAAAPAPAPAGGGILIPERKPERGSPLLAERPEAGPSLGGFMTASGLVMLLMVGAFMLFKKYGRRSKLFGGEAIKVLSRRALGQRQEVFLVEVGPKVFLVGATKDRLSTLGEFSDPVEVAALRADLPVRGGASERIHFRQTLDEGIREQEAPARPEGAYASIAGELAEIRRTVQAWRA